MAWVCPGYSTLIRTSLGGHVTARSHADLLTAVVFCLLADGETSGAKTAGIEKGWSPSTSCSLRFVLKSLTEFRSRKVGGHQKLPTIRTCASSVDAARYCPIPTRGTSSPSLLTFSSSLHSESPEYVCVQSGKIGSKIRY